MKTKQRKKRDLWLEDEWVVVLGHYFFYKQTVSKPLNLEQFTEKLNSYTGKKRAKNSIELRIRNYVSLDSENPSKGMANGSPTLKRYWDEYIERDPSHALLKKRYNDFLNWDINDKPPVYPDELSNNFVGYYEGENKPVLVNQYERDPKARRACIKNYGAVCFICGFDFGETYGKEFTGRIHVHHLVEVSKRAGKYKVDPIKDLRPVCPNCHMVLHCKKDGLYEIDEVKAMLIVERKD